MPSKEEVEEHYLTHLPSGSWFQFCVQGKGTVVPHFKQKKRADGLTETRFDNCFMSTHGSPMATMLVAREKSTRMTLANLVPMKGGSIEFPARRALSFLKEIGLEGADVVFKSDQEPALKDLLNNIANRRSATSKIEKFDKYDLHEVLDDATRMDRKKETLAGSYPEESRTLHESSPVGSSQSNGFIERGIQDVEVQVRTLKLAFESHIGEKIRSDHNAIPWLVEYAAVLLNRGQVGSDGETSYERFRGKPANLPGLQFGDRLLWRTNAPSRDRRNRMDTPTSKGIYLGQRTVSGEYLVGSAEGVFRLRTVYRVPAEEMWNDNLSLVIGLPWKHNAEHEVGEDVMLDAYAPVPSSNPVGSPLPPRTLEEPMKVVKRFYAKTRNLDPSGGRIGWTAGCKGCEPISRGNVSQVAHSENCRMRVIEKTASNPTTVARLRPRAVENKSGWQIS